MDDRIRSFMGKIVRNPANQRCGIKPSLRMSKFPAGWTEHLADGYEACSPRCVGGLPESRKATYWHSGSMP